MHTEKKKTKGVPGKDKKHPNSGKAAKEEKPEAEDEGASDSVFVLNARTHLRAVYAK